MGSPLRTAGTYLLALARRNAAVYATHLQVRAILLMGSAAEGQSDFFSDLDMAIYYDELPSDEIGLGVAPVGAIPHRPDPLRALILPP